MLDPANERVPASARRFLATLLEDENQYEHYFLLVNNQVAEYAVRPLVGWADHVNPTAVT